MWNAAEGTEVFVWDTECSRYRDMSNVDINVDHAFVDKLSSTGL